MCMYVVLPFWIILNFSLSLVICTCIELPLLIYFSLLSLPLHLIVLLRIFLPRYTMLVLNTNHFYTWTLILYFLPTLFFKLFFHISLTEDSLIIFVFVAVCISIICTIILVFIFVRIVEVIDIDFWIFIIIGFFSNHSNVLLPLVFIKLLHYLLFVYPINVGAPFQDHILLDLFALSRRKFTTFFYIVFYLCLLILRLHWGLKMTGVVSLDIVNPDGHLLWRSLLEVWWNESILLGPGLKNWTLDSLLDSGA